jgi:surface polysaccharide O-acyltransferase-like enzyme
MNVYDSLVRWTVPMFVMISGFFHLKPNKKGLSFTEEMKIIYKKIFRIICVIIFWGIAYNTINMLAKYFIKNESFGLYDLVKIPGIIILGPAYYHLWFLYMLIGLYLLTPIFRCFINNCKQEHIEYILILFFVIGTCFPLINNILNNFSIFKGRQIYFPVPELTGYIGYYIAGYYFGHYKIENKTKFGIYILAIISILFTIVGTALEALYKKEATGTLYGGLLPNTMFITYALFILFEEVKGSLKLSERQKRIIVKISKDTFGVYLIHALIIQMLDVIGISTLIVNPIISIPIISIFVYIVSYSGTIIINKIPVLNKYVV